jgi:hypothetical protein
MPNIILFIREPGKPDLADVHESYRAAKGALLEHVKAHWTFADMAMPKDPSRAIRAFFARTGGRYVIAEVEGRALDSLSFPGEA